MANKISAKLLEQIIEGALLVSGKPIAPTDVKNYFSEDDIVPHITDVRAAFKKLEKRYKARGIELKEVASGYRFQVAEEVAPFVIKQWEEKPQKYSRALLETLALIAYRQPITRGDIEDVRGVAVSSNIVRTLLEREWVRVVGHKDVPGRPALYATTSKFLDYFNLKSLTELPELSEVKDLEAINPELDFGEEFQLTSDAQVSDDNADFDGDAADLIPDTEEPVDEAIEELTDIEKEEIRLAKEAAHKEKELQQEMAAREELQDIDRFNNAFEKMIRTPDAQMSMASVADNFEGSDASSEEDASESDDQKKDLPGWWAQAQESVADEAQGDGVIAQDDVAEDVTTELESAELESAELETDESKSRFAKWADRLEASVQEIEQQELLMEEMAEEEDEDTSFLESDIDQQTNEDSFQGDDAEIAESHSSVIDNTDAESKLTERTYGQQIAGEEMSEEDIQRLIQQKLAEQAKLLNQRPSEEDSEEE